MQLLILKLRRWIGRLTGYQPAYASPSEAYQFSNLEEMSQRTFIM
ncbi:hypothetical protein BN8_01073 [Fibrisoma limi BUZ 3]|uniref:Uncharacterized protein n=1 Tax=Fibrisoma limi BUZ 3 TaxID=1185876 RepID=I2GDX5_9BACT|nr:hypothetical protein [Fibrisoma limi]CCH52100.1 hypothetical protein BN8_01073 [Fibrisoma limi BUZ 3]